MITRLLIAAIAFSPVVSAAEDSMSRLRYTVPDGWTPGIDGRTLLPPGGNAAVTFAPSTEFAGTAEQWIEQSWKDISRELKVISGPAPGTQGAFLTRIGVLRQADEKTVWLCLNTLVKDGRGESVIYLAGDETQFRTHLAALSKMLRGTSVAPPAGSTSVPSSTNAPASSVNTTPTTTRDTGVAGLYLASTSQFRFSPLGSPGGGSWEWRTEFYLLSRDGRLFRGPDLPKAPGGDIGRFDYEAARREAPASYGTYTVRGEEVVMRVGDSETINAKWIAPDTLEIRGTKFKRSIREGSSSSGNAAASPSAPAMNNVVPLLAYTEPAGFVRGAAAPPSLIDYTSNNANAGVQIYHFRPYSGDIAAIFQQTLLRDWIDPNYRESELTAPPELLQYRVPGATLALVAGFHEKRTGIPNERMRMLIVADSMAAIIDIHAYNSSSWQTITPAVRALLDSLRVERKSPPMTNAQEPAPISRP